MTWASYALVGRETIIRQVLKTKTSNLWAKEKFNHTDERVSQKSNKNHRRDLYLIKYGVYIFVCMGNKTFSVIVAFIQNYHIEPWRYSPEERMEVKWSTSKFD